MPEFSDRLYDAINMKKSAVCVGLDPNWEKLPECIKKKYDNPKSDTLESVAKAIYEFNQRIIDAVADLAPVVKPQIAYYEIAGHHGIKAFFDTCKYAQEKGLIVIGDVKRGDISSTASAYAQAYLGKVEIGKKKIMPFGLDAITINPYFGTDGIRPFVEQACENEAGIFILVRTSNPSSDEIQNVNKSNGVPFYIHIAELVKCWSVGTHGKKGFSSVGAVVGATHPVEAKELRKILPSTFFLVPGYGAQGGTAEDVRPCFMKNGTGAIVNASRSIIYAHSSKQFKDKYTDEQFEAAAREATGLMKDDLNSLWK